VEPLHLKPLKEVEVEVEGVEVLDCLGCCQWARMVLSQMPV
jgi:hypothetical protein